MLSMHYKRSGGRIAVRGKKWYHSSFRRCLVDMHIEDWDPAFLSGFDPAAYAESMRQAHVQTAMLYANSHVGHCYWPTESGHTHAAAAGRDLLKETAARLRGAGMDVVLYYTLIYNNWACDHVPDCAMRDGAGNGPRKAKGGDGPYTGRYGLCCPNAPAYRSFVREQLTELCRGYTFDGIFLDMTFWPQVCYCGHCRARYAAEAGGEMPARTDWADGRWRAFQAMREAWMTEFALFCTGIVREHKPGAAVEHQYSTAPGDWRFGVTAEMARASDFASGDLYGGYAQQSAVCKLFDSLTTDRPFEYMTSRCYPNLHDHTTMKTQEMLALHNALTLAHNGAFLFIDAIDPRGTMNPEVYRRLGAVFGASQPYEPFLTGEMAQDAGIYYSLTAKYDPDDPEGGAQPHLQAVLGAADCLRRSHIPFGIVSSTNLGALGRHRFLVLPDLLSVTAAEAEAFRAYVRGGGALYASGRIDLALLGDLFGLAPLGRTKETYTYISPAGDAGGLLPGVSEQYPLAVDGRQALARAEGCDVLARVTLPCTDPADFGRFASIHSNPPGEQTAHPALTRRAWGRGVAVWCAAAVEAVDKPPHRACAEAIFRSLLRGEPTAALEGPPCVELLRFDDGHTCTIRLVNLQETAPVLPVHGLTVKVACGGRTVRTVEKLPGREPVKFWIEDGNAAFTVDRLDLFDMFRVEFN